MSELLSLYTHFPFCSTKCAYCAFNTFVQMETWIEPFVEALAREIAIVGRSQPYQSVRTIFLGGGTPSLLTPSQIEQILVTIHQQFAVLDSVEISLESNPDDLNVDYLVALHALGINRLSIGMQSAQAEELMLFGRRHSQTMTVRAVEAARQAGFDSLNLDLIYGIPRQTLASWRASLQEALNLHPEHLSLYALGVEDKTPLQNWITTGKLPAPDDDLVADMYEMATDVLGSAGYEQYEISNWAKPGFQCQHNLQYWRNWPYVGFGPGAHGFAAGIRYSNLLPPVEYIHALQQANQQDQQYEFPRTPVTDDAVMVDRDNEIVETLMMGLRLTREGIQREAFIQRFGVDVLDLYDSIMTKFAQYGLLSVESDSIRLTRKGRLLSNMVFRELMPD